MALTRISGDLSLNPEHIVSAAIDQRHYMNGPGDAELIITMVDGTKHRIKHQPHCFDGANIYEIERRLSSASIDTAVLQDDLRELLRLLGLPDGARPQSPHEVFQECLTVLRARLAA